MPIYEYQCESCGERFERRRSLNDSDIDIQCPKCGAKNPKRSISGFSGGSSSEYSCAPTHAGGG